LEEGVATGFLVGIIGLGSSLLLAHLGLKPDGVPASLVEVGIMDLGIILLGAFLGLIGGAIRGTIRI